jgi:glycogen debranching enzyme
VVSAAPVDPHHPYHVIFGGYTVLVAGADGMIDGTGREGLYDQDTRVLSRWQLALDGERPGYVSSCAGETDRWSGHLRVVHRGDPVGPALPQDTVEVWVSRRVGRGLEEHLQVENHGMTEVNTRLSLEFGADFQDIMEVEGAGHHDGETTARWDAPAVIFAHRARHDGRTAERNLRIRLLSSTTPVEVTADGAAATMSFPVTLAPHARWFAALSFESWDGGRWRIPPRVLPGGGTRRDQARAAWHRVRTRLVCPNAVVEGAFERAADDLFALRNWPLDVGPDAWVPNAGIPAYTGLFGRDVLTAGWQAALLGPEPLRGALARIAERQAKADDPWRDAEPGKLIHEARRGLLSELEILPQAAYYGTQTTSAMFVVTLSELWHWTGDTDELRRYRDVALGALDWAERYGDRDGDGFLEYTRRSPHGLKNHAWKDSDEAIRYPDGSLVENPIATVEEQAYHAVALERMAEILYVLGDRDRSAAFRERAARLARRIDAAFWCEADGFYAMALDPEKRPVRSIGSNAGHVLACGIVPPGRARRVADRLLSPELFSGWGVRTLSVNHPSYNPYAYHLGTVWPVENATFALAFKRYGLEDHLARLVGALFDAAGNFRAFRLPELLGGHDRALAVTPTLYPRANSPQAWSASAAVQLVQAMLGLYPFAPGRVLSLIRPTLPEWLPELELHGLRVGDATVSLRFFRDRAGRTRHEVLSREGTLRVMAAPPPNADGTLRRGEAARAFALRHAPGHVAEVARLGMGFS